jgi:hypothetical protein
MNAPVACTARDNRNAGTCTHTMMVGLTARDWVRCARKEGQTKTENQDLSGKAASGEVRSREISGILTVVYQHLWQSSSRAAAVNPCRVHASLLSCRSTAPWDWHYFRRPPCLNKVMRDSRAIESIRLEKRHVREQGPKMTTSYRLLPIRSNPILPYHQVDQKNPSIDLH